MKKVKFLSHVPTDTCFSSKNVNLHIIQPLLLMDGTDTYMRNAGWTMASVSVTVFCGQLTAVVAERGELDPLLSVAGAVVHFHLQLVPRGLLQVVQDVALGQGGALGRGPRGRVDRSVFQGEGGDGTSAIVPANQVKPDPSGVDAGEELLLLRVLRFCNANARETQMCQIARMKKNLA